MTEIMHQVKKYANGRLYDATYKKYITMEEIEDFVRTGVIFKVVVSKTGEDITDSVIAKIKEEMKSESGKKTEPEAKTKIKPKATQKIQVKQKSGPESESESVSAELISIFSELLEKGSGMFAGCARGYMDLWHSAMGMAEEEFDKRVKQLVRAKELSESEAGQMKKEVIGFVRNLKKWVGANVEERIHDIISAMNLATRSQVEELAEKINGLNIKLAMLERMENEREDTTEGIAD
jgi:polyhydroxyalkanoate synthesis regulator protein